MIPVLKALVQEDIPILDTPQTLTESIATMDRDQTLQKYATAVLRHEEDFFLDSDGLLVKQCITHGAVQTVDHKSF